MKPCGNTWNNTIMRRQKGSQQYHSASALLTIAPMLLIVGLLGACNPSRQTLTSMAVNKYAPGADSFYREAAAMNWQQRDALAVSWVNNGYYPPGTRHFKLVRLQSKDTMTGEKYKAKIWVSTDYLALGNKSDWARICITPMAAQKIIQQWHCVLPTTKMVDAIYDGAKVKLEPVPMYAYRDSTPTMWQHHLIIEGQRNGQKGLVAGIKKDVVQSPVLLQEGKQNKVAIYGWHKLDGKPIQPLYTGHVNWYVDYSHGIRLVHERVRINGRLIMLREALAMPQYHDLFFKEKL